jgi:hypothetical protein
MYFYIYPYPLLLLPVCTVHYNRAPVTSATPHVWNQNSIVVQTMFISSHENERSFSNEAQRLVYRRLRCCTKRRLRDTRSVADSSLVHSSTFIPPHFFTPLTIVKINHFSATHLFLAHIVIGHLMAIVLMFPTRNRIPSTNSDLKRAATIIY